MVENNRNDNYDNDPMLDTITSELRAPVRPTEKLGAYLKGVILNRQWTLEDLAVKLGHQTTLMVSALVEGHISEDVIDDDMIEDLARVIERSPNVIRVILGRRPQNGSRLETLISEHSEQREALVETLVNTLSSRYDNQVDGDVHRRKQYDFVIRQLEEFIARQKQDLEIARRLVQQLQEEDPDESMKLDLQRIINRIVADVPEPELRHYQQYTRPKVKQNPQKGDTNQDNDNQRHRFYVPEFQPKEDNR